MLDEKNNVVWFVASDERFTVRAPGIYINLYARLMEKYLFHKSLKCMTSDDYIAGGVGTLVAWSKCTASVQFCPQFDVDDTFP